MNNETYALIAAFLISICALAWSDYQLRIANGQIEHLTNMSKQSDSLSLATIGTLQNNLAECQRGNFEEKTDSLPAPEPKPVVKPALKKKALRAPTRRYTRKRHAEKKYEYQQPTAESSEGPHWHWGLW